MNCKALFFFFLLPGFLCAQNLVPNGSFEDYVSCPEHLDGMEFVEHWYKSIIEPGVDYYLNPSPDYYHECALNPAVGVPDNIIGSQTAHDGMAYCGLFTYDDIWPNDREVIGTSLISPLMPGQTYYCSLYFVRAVGWSMAGLATNNICMKFSNEEFFTNTAQATDGVAQIVLNEVGIDSVNWGMLYAELTPEESFQYLHIGNFFSSENTEIESYSSESRFGYYFIDNVRVSTEPLLTTSADGLRLDTDLTIFPNPVDGDLNVVSMRKVTNVKLFGVSGKLIEEFSLKKKGLFSLNVEHISKGLYIAIIYFENGEMESVKINKN